MSSRFRRETERLRAAVSPRALFSGLRGGPTLPVGALRVLGVLVAVAVVAAAALGARALANHDATNARKEFRSDSARVASNVGLSLQHAEDLIVAASTFIAAKPGASSAEFTHWTKFASVTARYPELRRLDVVALLFLVPATSIPTTPTAPTARGTLSTATSTTARTALTGTTSTLAATTSTATRAASKVGTSARAGALLPVLSTSPEAALALSSGRITGGMRCVIIAGLAHVASPTATTRDLCRRNPALLASRDSGRALYAKVSVHGREGLEIDTPVYRSGLTPSNTAARRAAFVGWVRTIVEPRVLLQGALAGRPELALRLRRRGAIGSPFVTPVPSSAAVAGALTAAFNLHGGWSLRTLGAPADATVFGNANSAALLIGGTALGLLVCGFALLADPRRRREQPARAAGESKDEELYDRLTGLPNRALTLDRAERMIARGSRQSGVLAGALMIDIDWFADINERFGKQAGDKVLTAVAERLQATMRAVDSIGRLGGDEFVVLVEASRGVKFDAVARRVIEALHEPIDVEGFGPSFVITASVGVAFGRYKSVEDLFADARLALVSAKSAGKDRYTLFNANMRSVVEGHGVLEGELSAALAERQLELVYAPIRDLRTNAIVGFEALVRWRHPERGVVPGDEFSSLAEDSGLIVPIGRFALEEACTRAAEWNLSERRVAVAVKVSAAQLRRDGFITDVRRALQLSGLEPALLTLEIEETTLIDDLDSARTRLAQLRELGVSIAADDFGNGYAFRTDLKGMPIDCIKVDRASLAESEGDDYRNWLLEAILSFGRDLAMNVIAAGVQYEPQLGALRMMGFPMAQGPAVGEPVPADAVPGLLEAPRPAPDAIAPPAPLAPAALTQRATVAPAAPAAPASQD
jgi:diguanylate cyclase (GGDEF)-like protein